VGVDGSENSEKALDYALEIAEKFSAAVQILNVFQPPPEIEYQLNMFQQTPASGILERKWVTSQIWPPSSETSEKHIRQFCPEPLKEQPN